MHSKAATGKAASFTSLKDNDVRMIRRGLAQGVPRKEIARDFRVSLETIHKIARGATFQWIADDPAEDGAMPCNAATQASREAEEQRLAEVIAEQKRSAQALQEKLAAANAIRATGRNPNAHADTALRAFLNRPLPAPGAQGIRISEAGSAFKLAPELAQPTDGGSGQTGGGAGEGQTPAE
jgi:hypothetical protein